MIILIHNVHESSQPISGQTKGRAKESVGDNQYRAQEIGVRLGHRASARKSIVQFGATRLEDSQPCHEFLHWMDKRQRAFSPFAKCCRTHLDLVRPQAAAVRLVPHTVLNALQHVPK